MKCKLANENFRDNYTYNLLKSRGVNDVEDFLNPKDTVLQNPEDFENIKAGADLLLDVISKNGKILIVVDSDNDGFTSSTIIYQYIKEIAPDIEINYILHEGKQHGLEDHIANLMEEGHIYDLIILPDSSSNDKEYHDQLATINTPCLVLDHHITDLEISNNAIVINNQLSPKYKNKELTGAGVTYQFCRYLDQLNNTSYSDNLIDLAAWGIIGDMGSVLELENRYIILKGLSNIHNTFLLQLMDKQGYSITGKMAPTHKELVDSMNPISVAFYIVPLINATIRVGTMEEKKRLFEAFIDGDKMIPSNKRGAKGTLERAGVEAARECTNARARQNRILDAAIGKIEARIHKLDLLQNRILFVRLEDDDDFPSELNGLVAMKLSQQFQRPTIVARLNKEGYDRGSMRGLNQSELSSFKDFLEESGYFEYVSGHDNAAGASLKDADLRAFHEWANEKLEDINFGENVYNVNFQRRSDDEDLADLITNLSEQKENKLWGQFNNEPLIYITDIKIRSSSLSIIGKNNDTLRFEVNGITYLKFKCKDLIAHIKEKIGELNLEVVGTANLNEWGGKFTPQIFIEELEIIEPEAVEIKMPEWASF